VQAPSLTSCDLACSSSAPELLLTQPHVILLCLYPPLACRPRRRHRRLVAPSYRCAPSISLRPPLRNESPHRTPNPNLTSDVTITAPLIHHRLTLLTSSSLPPLIHYCLTLLTPPTSGTVIIGPPSFEPGRWSRLGLLLLRPSGHGQITSQERGEEDGPDRVLIS
jgi:hypothetical protein